MSISHEQQHAFFSKETWRPWWICFAASLFFFYEFIQGNMFASIADDLMRDFEIQASGLAYLSSVYYIANVLFLFVAGVVLDRLSAKKAVIITMLMCIISTFVLSQAHDFSVAMICRFVAGIGSAFCFLGPIRIASQWFPPQRMAVATGLIVTIAMTGGMLSQYPLTKLVLHIGWRNALMWVGILGFAILGFMMAFIQDKVKTQKESSDIGILASFKIAYLNLQTLGAACYASLLNMGVAVFGAVMGSLYLMQRLGIDKEKASLINTMLFLGTIFGGPLMGWISDKMGRRIAPMAFGGITSLVTILAILYLPVSYAAMVVLFFLLGLFTSSQIISYAFVAESTSPAMTATAVSIVCIFAQSGYVLFQNIFSALLTYHGEMKMVDNVPVYSLNDYQFAALIMPIGLMIALLILLGLRETFCRRKG